MPFRDLPMCDQCWFRREPVRLPVRFVGVPRIEYCAWCACRTDTGIYVRADTDTVPFPDKPADARVYISLFRRHTLPGADYVDTDRGRRVNLDRMTDGDAVLVAGEFRRMETEAAMLRRKERANQAAPVRRLRLS